MIFPNKTSHVAAVTPFSGYWKWILARICSWSVAEEAEYVMSHASAGIIFFFCFLIVRCCVHKISRWSQEFNLQ